MEKDFSKVLPKIERVCGSVVTYLVKCSRNNCKCSVGELHGPYFYRCWRENGKQRKQYIKRDSVEAVQSACTNYREQCQRVRQSKEAQLAQWRSLKARLREISTNE